MATRRPLVLSGGRVKELPAGDATVGSSAPTEVTLDFGTVPTHSKGFSFADAGAVVGQRVVMTPQADGDEYEMDGFTCAAHVVDAGSIAVYVHAMPGPVRGTRKFNYVLG
jgi:hypothetical protein